MQNESPPAEMTVIEISAHRWGWKVFEAPDVKAGVPREAHTLGFRLSPNGAVLSDYQQIRGANTSFEADGRKFRKKVNRIATIQHTRRFMAVA